MKILIVDPSLFTAPYNAGLDEGLRAHRGEPLWVVRPLRRGEERHLPPETTHALFYKCVDDAAGLPRKLRGVAKGLAHFAGLFRLFRLIRAERPDIVHFQWAVLPLIDAIAMRALKRMGIPIVMTVHDSTPFNGEHISLLQNRGFDAPIRAADRVIVHTEAGRRALVGRGADPDRIHVVPHGPLAPPVAAAGAVSPYPRDDRTTFVMFGHIRPYKGPDLMIEAVAMLAPEVRARIRVIVAGEPRMDVGVLIERVAALGLADVIHFRLGRLCEEAMALLFAETDVFLFPYRRIDASGAYYMLRPLGRWMIASRVGVFAEDFVEGGDGRTVPPLDVPALAAAIAEAAGGRPERSLAPRGTSWAEIGAATMAVYARAAG